MTLLELDTPIEKRRAIQYGNDGNSVVRHWYDLRHVVGSLYMGEITEDDYGVKEFGLFLFFPGVKDGMLYGWYRCPENYTLENLSETLKRYGFETVDTFLTTLDEHMERNIHIGNAIIEFVRQWNPDKANEYAEYRERRYAAIAERERQERMAEAAREAEEKAAEEAALNAKKALYFGWADSMTPLRFSRVDTCLNTPIRVDGKKVMTRREFVIESVKNGWMPRKQEGVTTWYGSRWDKKESKPKTVYSLSKEHEGYDVSKTEYDFAMYLADHMEVLK